MTDTRTDPTPPSHTLDAIRAMTDDAEAVRASTLYIAYAQARTAQGRAERDARIRRMHERGVPPSQIAQLTGVNLPTVKALCRR